MKQAFNTLLFLFLFLITKGLSAAVYYVNDGFVAGDIFCTAVGNNANVGTSPSTPKLTLKNLWNTYGPSGTNVLTSGDTIKIDAGTYSVTGFASVDEAKFDITVAGLNFLGAGVGVTIFDHNFHGGTSDYFMWIKANNVTVKNLTVQEFAGCSSCSGVVFSGVNTGGQAFTIDNATGVVLYNVQTNNNGGNGNAAITVGPNSQVVIRGGGSTCNAAGAIFSGGIDVLGSNINLLIEDYILAYNSKSAFFGSALYVFGNNVTTVVNVRNTRITNNTGKEGTGLYLDGGNVSLRNCMIGNNSSTGGTYGGGVVIYEGTVKLSNTTIVNNSGNKGGGIAVFPNNGNVSLTLDSCLFSSNTASASRGVDLYARPDATNIFTITAQQTTFSSVGNVITLEGTNSCVGSSISLTNCGNPPVQNLSSFCANPTFINTTLPTFTPTPNPPNFSGVCGSIVILPVELVQFEAREVNDNQVAIEWQTSSEIYNDFFKVERSSDAISWTELGRIRGNGNSNVLLDYQLMDYWPSVVNYYRLIQFDVNGDSVVYGPVYLELINPNQAPQIQVYPNPASTQLFVRSHIKGDHIAQLVDLNGIVLQEMNMHSMGIVEFNIEMMSAGIYFVKCMNDEEIRITKVLIH